MIKRCAGILASLRIIARREATAFFVCPIFILFVPQINLVGLFSNIAIEYVLNIAGSLRDIIFIVAIPDSLKTILLLFKLYAGPSISNL